MITYIWLLISIKKFIHWAIQIGYLLIYLQFVFSRRPASSSALFHQCTENEELNLVQIELALINLSIHCSKGSAFNPQKEKASRNPKFLSFKGLYGIRPSIIRLRINRPKVR